MAEHPCTGPGRPGHVEDLVGVGYCVRCDEPSGQPRRYREDRRPSDEQIERAWHARHDERIRPKDVDDLELLSRSGQAPL